MKKLFIGLAIAVGIISGGCIGDGSETVTTIDNTSASVKTTETYAVVIGMENSRFAGPCPGAKLDSDRMCSLISKYAKRTTLLQDSNATHARVKAAIEDAVSKSANGLFILYYSGHGGSEPFPDTGIEETDGSDEYLCLYDAFMRDNEVWSLISKCKGRVFIITDSCHSQSQFRSRKFLLLPPLGFDHTINETHSFSMLCWSGCPDSDYSYGSSTGGQFTNTLLKYFSSSYTYQELWDKIKVDKTLRAYENPQSTVIGGGFYNNLIFR